jgi:hypothetical protein
LAVAGFSRLAMLSVVDAVLWSGDDKRYVFPAALVLSAMVSWLLAEGMRLLFRALPGSRKPEFASAP